MTLIFALCSNPVLWNHRSISTRICSPWCWTSQYHNFVIKDLQSLHNITKSDYRCTLTYRTLEPGKNPLHLHYSPIDTNWTRSNPNPLSNGSFTETHPPERKLVSSKSQRPSDLLMGEVLGFCAVRVLVETKEGDRVDRRLFWCDMWVL